MSIYFISKLPLPNGAHHWIGPLHYHKALPSWPVHHPTEQCRWALTCYRQLTPCPKAIHNRIRVYCSLAMYVELHMPVTYIVTDVSMTIAIVTLCMQLRSFLLTLWGMISTCLTLVCSQLGLQ